MQPQLQPTERLIKSVRANHLTDGMHMKGTLWLTNLRLIFFTHHFNARQYQLELPLRTIQSVELYNHFHIFPYGMIITTTDGTAHHLAVWRRHHLKTQIRRAMKMPNSSEK